MRISKDDPELVGYGLMPIGGGGVIADLGSPWTLHAWGEPTVRIGLEQGLVVDLDPVAIA